MEITPLDDIMEVYGKLSKEKKSAVTNLMKSDTYIAACAHDAKGKHVTLDWQGNQAMSIHLIMGMIITGRNEYGRIWLDDLKNKLSRMA